MAAVCSASAEAVAASASATRRPPLFRAASFRPTPRRLPAAAVATSAPSSRGVACKAKDASALDDVPDVAQSTWDEVVLGCEAPVLVEFWAPWCGPCRLMHPIIAELARRYAGRLRCLKLNTDDNQDVATRYGIRSIPTILIFKNGERKETVIGAVPDTTLATTVERFL